MNTIALSRKWAVGVVVAAVVGVGGFGIATAANAAAPEAQSFTQITPAEATLPHLSDVVISVPVELGAIDPSTVPNDAGSTVTRAK